MAKSPAQVEKRVRVAINLWRSLKPTKKFLGLTVDAFKAELKP